MFKAVDKQASNKTVAIKIQSFDGEQRHIIDDEYRILRDFNEHPNLLDFYGVYRKKVSGGCDQIWFVLEVSRHEFIFFSVSGVDPHLRKN